MRAVRQPDLKSHIRELQCGAPLLMVELNDHFTFTFDFNFGEGQKDLLFGLIFSYDSDEEALTES